MKNATISNELKRLAAENGGMLKPESVVEAAKPKNSPLHDNFEWDDGEAAHQWRLAQARQLIRVCVEVIPQSDDPMPVFVSLSSDRVGPGGGYRIMTHVMSDHDAREQLLRDALFELNAFQRKYRKLQELGSVFSEIRKLKKAA